MTEPLRPDLDRAWPAESSFGRGRWIGYRRYPAFCWPWLWRRARLFFIVILTFAVLRMVAVGSTLGDARLALQAGVWVVLAFFLMSQSGPLLATLVRHRRWPLRVERIAVVIAIVVGMALAAYVDRQVTGWLDAEVRPRLEQSGEIAPQPSPQATRGLTLGKVANILVMVLIYGALGGALALREYFAEPRRLADQAHRQELDALRAAAQASDLRLAVLQAQVEPHFLFNTLASLRLLIREDPTRAEQVLDALVLHLRATIPQMRSEELAVRSTLGQQLDICAGYLDLMRVRLGDRLHATVSADAELRGLPFPPLLLITLVENAIKHGIEPKRGNGRIEVSARREDAMLIVAVADDGVGLQPGPSGGLGLANVREHLRTRFGARARLEIGARPGGGTLAEIRVPVEDAT